MESPVITVGPRRHPLAERTFYSIALDAPYFASMADKIELHNEIVRFHTSLNIREKRWAKALYLRIYRKRKFKEIAEQLGVSKARAAVIESQGRHRIARCGRV